VKNFDPALATSPLPLAYTSHAFRGAFADQCSIVERWAVSVLAKVPSATSQYLFGQKLGAVRKLAEGDLTRGAARHFKNPKRVLILLDRFQPFAEMRSALAHSVQSIQLRADGQAVFLFQPIGRSKPMAIALAAPAQEALLRELSSLAKQFTDQAMR
jgi:hypothetical protein